LFSPRPRYHFVMTAPGTIPIRLNGRPGEAPVGSTLAELLMSLGMEGPGLAVAVNERVVRRDDHPTTRIAPGDRIEIIQAVGGG
jgi:sulfur carrier protein